MTPTRSTRRPAAPFPAALALLLVLSACGGDDDAAPPTRGASADGPGFVESAVAAGLRFTMNYLPLEQGENFKINMYDHGAGVAVADVDGDGDDDVCLLNQLGRNALFRNDGKGRFTDATHEAGIALDDLICVAATFADYDEDGDQDLYVTTSRGGNHLFRNRGDGTFEDVTKAAGLSLVAHSEGAVFFDADGDGDQDLVVTNTAEWTTETYDEQARYYRGTDTLMDLARAKHERNRYYANRGDGTFSDETQDAGLEGLGWGGDMAVFDMDDDGDLDLFVSNMLGQSILYRNDGKGHFRDATADTLKVTPFGTVASRVLDYDGDGRLDLLLIDMHSDMWMDFSYSPTPKVAASKWPYFLGPMIDWGQRTLKEENDLLDAFGRPRGPVVYGSMLYRNLGGGRFQDVSDKAGIETLWPWGIAAGDFDANGWEDVFIPSGMGYPYAWWPAALLMGDGSGTYANRAFEEGVAPPPEGRYLPTLIKGKQAARSGRAAATADFDGDGRLDLVVNNFNDRAYLYMNRWPARHWAKFRLVGSRSTKDAVGAVVRLRVGDRTYVRTVESGAGYLSQSSRTLHFGLGSARKIDACEVRWPSGAVQSVDDVRLDALNVVREPAK